MLLTPGAHRGVQGAVRALWQMHKAHPGLQRREKCRGHRARMTGAREIGLQKRTRGFKKYIGFKAMLAAKSVEELAERKFHGVQGKRRRLRAAATLDDVPECQRRIRRGNEHQLII